MPHEPRPLAQQLFDAHTAFEQIESETYTALCRILGIDRAAGQAPSFVRWSFDEVDASFDLFGVLPSVSITTEQLHSFWKLGFEECLFHYQGGKEMIYYIGSDVPEVYE